jgi:hypothetical protein
MHELRLRSIVGLTPLFAAKTLEPGMLRRLPRFAKRLHLFLERRTDLASLVSRWDIPGIGERRMLSLLSEQNLKRLLTRMLDEAEFLSPYGIRSLSRAYADNPYVFESHGGRIEVRYEPGESRSAMFGGNSNWRGPVWMPINYMIIEALERFHFYYGDGLTVEYPTGSGQQKHLREIAADIRARLLALFMKDSEGKRAIHGQNQILQNDPHFRDNVWFHEYFDGDNGIGLGASHQTGWTGLIANLIGNTSTVTQTRRDAAAR